MNYVVFDLEWNQCPYGKDREIKRLPFEIVEIGAVLLNEKKEILDTFHSYVRPVVYKRIHHRTQQVIGVTMKELKTGKPFPEAVKAFLRFCGQDYRFCTWGTQDLDELQRNLAYYGLSGRLPRRLFYEDIQKIFALTYEGKKSQRSLAYGAEYLGISQEGDFHRALDDAMYTALIMQKLPDDMIREYYSIDYYHVPATKEEEIRIHYKTYEKYVSRAFASKEGLLRSSRVREVGCFLCGSPPEEKRPYFPVTSGKTYLNGGICPEHGPFQVKLRIKKADQGCFAVRTTRMLTDDEYTILEEKRAGHGKNRKKSHHSGKKTEKKPFLDKGRSNPI